MSRTRGKKLNKINYRVGWMNLHMVTIDGAFNNHAVFYPVKPPTKQDLDAITDKTARRPCRWINSCIWPRLMRQDRTIGR